MKSANKTLLSWGLILLLMITSPGIFLAIVLLISAETSASRFFALSLITLSAATILLVIVIRTFRKPVLISAFILYGFGIIGLLGCYLIAPSGHLPPNTRLQSLFPTGQKYVRWSPANLVREIDQMKLGTLLMPYLDPYIDQPKGRRLKHLFLTVYRQMQKDSQFVEIGSAMHYAYAELGNLAFDTRHLYVYIPQRNFRKKLPVILFLHGSLGNFKGYLWVWKQFADTHQFAIVAPSFGFGNWHRQGGVATIEAARQYCIQHPELDEKRIILAGLSNGGLGVSRAASLNPHAYQGLLYISGVMERNVLISPEFVQGWKKRPVFIIHGSQDARIPKDYVDRRILDLYHNNIRPEVKFYDDEDHFLFFSKRFEMMEEIHQWISR
ncbi:MAG: alpha/beta fold hydrolase [Gammaproteobacteria bacterium]|nr:alpha/beta fold hydrolase [Gammaproteobacteria bacterium]